MSRQGFLIWAGVLPMLRFFVKPGVARLEGLHAARGERQQAAVAHPETQRRADYVGQGRQQAVHVKKEIQQ